MNGHDYPAFPTAEDTEGGISMWDYFAAHAPLPAISSQGPNAEWQADELAHRAANYADAMMAERFKRRCPAVEILPKPTIVGVPREYEVVRHIDLGDHRVKVMVLCEGHPPNNWVQRETLDRGEKDVLNPPVALRFGSDVAAQQYIDTYGIGPGAMIQPVAP